MLSTVKKGVAGSVAAGLAALGQAFADGSVTPEEWGVVVGAVVGGFLIVFLAPKNGEKSDTKTEA